MIKLTAIHHSKIFEHAEQSYPRECCGLLIGHKDNQGIAIVTHIAQSPNTAKGSGQDTFELDPQVRFKVMRRLKGTNDEIIGHYHSHPDHPAQPSMTDLDMAFEPEFVWLIVSVNKGKADDLMAWRLDRDTRTITPLTLT